jgi:type VI secretion system protein ImpC
MADAQSPQTPEAAETVKTEEKASLLDNIFAQVDVHAPSKQVDIDEFDDNEANAEKEKGALVAAALRVFLDAVAQRENRVEKIDKYLLDDLVAQIDEKISEQLDEILHHDAFQELESAWRGLKFVVDRTDFRENVQIEMLNASKDDLRYSFEDVPELIQSPLYEHVYSGAYDQPGADPYSAIVSNYEFENTAPDIALLQNVSKVAASSHCPFLGSVGPKFFGKESMEEWKKIPDLAAHLSTVEYTKWNSFRDTDDARYVGLTFPKFMSRLPYGPDTIPVKGFGYEERVTGEDHEKYLWSNAVFPMAANMVQAFISDGWTNQIRGPQSGGKVEDLPVHLYDAGRGKQMKIPTEVPISETLEFEAANLGFIPLSVYEGRDYACFFSANSAQRPTEYDDPQATANSRINARLPYVLLASRIAHYLKVLQRENIGATKDAGVIQNELNNWMRNLITRMPNPTEDLIAKYPLRDGQVTVEDVESNPGFYRVSMMIMPHFQIEGMDINLSLVGKMPKAE